MDMNILSNLSKLGEDETKQIITSEMVIDKNLIIFDTVSLQISNICQISVSTPAIQKPIKAIAVFLLSIMLLIKFTLIGIVGAMLSGVYIYMVYQQNLNKGEYLWFYLNSGNTYRLHSRSPEFLKEIREVVEHCMNHHNGKKIAINMDQCDISNSPIILDGANEVSYED